MSELEWNKWATQLMQAGAEEFAKAAGIPQAKYQQIVLGLKWRNTLKEKRTPIVKQAQKKLEEA